MGVDVEQVRAPSSPWRDLVDGLFVDTDRIVERVTQRLPDPPPDLAAIVGALLHQLRTGSLPGEPPGRTLATFVEVGEQQASSGATVADLLRIWRACADTVIDRARELTAGRAAVAGAGAGADALPARLQELVTTWLDAGIAASIEGHRGVDLERSRQVQHARAGLIRRLVAGRPDAADVQSRAAAFGLDAGARYHAVRARPTAGMGARQLERYLGGVDAAGRPGGVLALIDGDICGFVGTLPTDPAPVAVGVSRATPLDELGSAFRTATRLLEAARALDRTGLITIESLGVEAAVVADDEVGTMMLDRYVRPLEALGPAGTLVLDTVSRYLGNDSRLDTTARELHVHVNTVRYRLGRFEQVTHRSLRDVGTLVEVWWALRRRSLT